MNVMGPGQGNELIHDFGVSSPMPLTSAAQNLLAPANMDDPATTKAYNLALLWLSHPAEKTFAVQLEPNVRALLRKAMGKQPPEAASAGLTQLMDQLESSGLLGAESGEDAQFANVTDASVFPISLKSGK